jgi:hypothetical protein
MTALDAYLTEPDWRERHERWVPATPETAVEAMLAAPAVPDRAVRMLFGLRGLPAGATIAESFARMGLEVLHESPAEVVVGASGMAWRPSGGIRPFAEAGVGTVRIAADVRAVSAAHGCMLSTETRVQAMDDDARRAFRRYWFLVRPFSGLIRRRWLAAVARDLSGQ